MEKIILNKSKFEEKDNNGAFVFPLLSEAHSPYLISLEDDVDLKGKTLYFVPGDVLRANGGTLKNGILSGILRIEDTLQQLFQLDGTANALSIFPTVLLILLKEKNQTNKIKLKKSVS